MYSLSDLKSAIEDPTRVVTELNRLYNRRLYSRDYNPDGIDIFDEDWDFLILLDACRYDYFKEQSTLPGDLEPRISTASSSVEFVRANFAGRDLHDVVILSANPWYARMYDDAEIDVHNLIVADADPEKLTNQAEEIAEKYPEKRIIIHYMQPHFPFLDPKWQEVFPPTDDLQTVSQKVEADRDTIREAYRDNLDIVLEHLERLFSVLEGRIVVSSDHGELLGDRMYPIPLRRYGHPRGIYVDDLVTVPWLVYEQGERRTITAEPPERDQSYDEEEIRESLRQLGYMF